VKGGVFLSNKKGKERFVFFKYVPPKKSFKPLIEKEKISNQIDAVGTGEAELIEVVQPDSPNLNNGVYPEVVPSVIEVPELKEEMMWPKYPETPSCPEMPEEPECPEMPEVPECPEMPEVPECPEMPEVPECPEVPEVPEVPSIPEGPCTGNGVMYVIVAGDTFWKLSQKYNTTVEAIVAANPMVDPLNLGIGETICIPTGIPGAKG